MKLKKKGKKAGVKMESSREREWFNFFVFVFLAKSVPMLLVLLKVPAPYGRHFSPLCLGPAIPARVGWILMEAPNLVVAAACVWTGDPKCLGSPLNLLLLSLFVGHYVNRTLIYPLRIRGGKPFSLSALVAGVLYTTLNGWIQSRPLTNWVVYTTSTDGQRVFLGAFFFFGALLNAHSDNILRSLRKTTSDQGYQIPRGGPFEYCTAANYFGELVEWLGFAVACWSWGSLAFALSTFCNLYPRARHNHQFMREKFKDEYPTSRSAFVPFLL